MPYFVLCWLFAAALASPLDLHGSQIVLDANYDNDNLTTSGEAFLGWHDPRMNGGRFLDVSDISIYKNNPELTQGNGPSTLTRPMASRLMSSFLPCQIRSS